MRRLGLKEGKQWNLNHTDSKWQGWGLDPGLPDFRTQSLIQHGMESPAWKEAKQSLCVPLKSFPSIPWQSPRPATSGFVTSYKSILLPAPTSFILTVKAFWLDYLCAFFSSKMLWFSKVNDSFCLVYLKRTEKPNLAARFEWYILVSLLSVFHLAIFCVPFVLQILVST